LRPRLATGLPLSVDSLLLFSCGHDSAEVVSAWMSFPHRSELLTLLLRSHRCRIRYPYDMLPRSISVPPKGTIFPVALSPGRSSTCIPSGRCLESDKITNFLARRAIPSVLPERGTLASGPKPCGRSPVQPKECRSGPAILQPVLKMAA
jgi:hypothetical protein